MLKEILNIRNFPVLAGQDNGSFIDKALRLLKTYGFILLFLLAAVPLLTLAEWFVTHILHLKSIRVQNAEIFERLIKKLGYTVSLIYICLIGPILEEMIFRFPLSFKRRHIATGAGLAFLLISGALPLIKELGRSGHPITALMLMILGTIAIYFITVKQIPRNLSFSAKQKTIFIASSIGLFALMHIGNYRPLQWPVIWLYPMYVIPQLLIGWGITYIRFKNGFLWGIALHCLTNTITMSLASNASLHLKNTKSVPAVVKMQK